MSKIRHLRLHRLEEREVGIGREELAVLLGERQQGQEEEPSQEVLRQRCGTGRGKKSG